MRGKFSFNLEKSDEKGVKSSASLYLIDYTDAEVERLKSLQYRHEYIEGFGGAFHVFRTPDGGMLVID